MNLSFVLPFYETDQDVKAQVEAIHRLPGENEILIFDERLQRPESQGLQAVLERHGVRYFPRAHRNRAALFNDGMQNASAPLVCVLPPDIYPEADFVTEFENVFADSQVAMAYSDYMVQSADGATREEKLWPFQNNIDERFSLGYFRVYRKSAVLDNGKFNEDLNYAEEYDFRLRIQDRLAVRHVAKPLYRCVMKKAQPVDPVLSKLHSPGAGSKGGFSYLFYTPEMEREIEFVFKDYLKRIGAFLTHDNAVVEYPPDARFEVMVSIVIPILNRRRFIRRTIDTVLNGTFSDFEILVVDNGSTDGTQDEVRSIPDPRVRLIENDGTCIAEALNRGIREARGKYIAQLDSDDEYMPDTLETMVAYMETHPKCGLAISYYDLIDEAGNPIEELGVIKHLEYDRNNILRVDGAGALRFFHKKVLEEFGLYNVENYGNFGEDYDMVLKISEKYDVDRVHKVLYRYRRHGDNTDVQRPAAMKVYNKNNARQDALKRRIALNRRLQAER
ncbi:MAG: glycosyltransferase [candidate division KSB1 bacterium]|nr:glycosyltransferase [candidate division KSB1 bacterium]